MLLNLIILPLYQDPVDELVSTTLDISNLSSASLSFKYAFAKRNSQNTDFMQVLASRDCGKLGF